MLTLTFESSWIIDPLKGRECISLRAGAKETRSVPSWNFGMATFYIQSCFFITLIYFIISYKHLRICVQQVHWYHYRCRRHDKKKQMKQNISTPYYTSRPTPYADTVSTEVSELSTKHHHIGKKYGDEGKQTFLIWKLTFGKVLKHIKEVKSAISTAKIKN